jgi:MarR-like DNA-binding transcriptional regulator SgrR of sgrS sRNA
MLQYAQLKAAVVRTRTNERDVWLITVEEIAGFLHCSQRNVKLLLHRMAENGWIDWMPGRGRGNRSQIRFLVSAEELLLEEAKAYVEQGNMKAAMGLLQGNDGLEPAAMERFLAWLGDYFGFKSSGSDSECSDTLRLPARAVIITLDPADIFFSRDLHFAKQVFDTLLRYDAQRRMVVPHLAHYWEHDGSGTVWTFYLRKGVMFHHGRELTAADAAYSFLRLRERPAGSTNRWLAEHIAAVRPLSKHVLQVELAAPNYLFPHYVSSCSLAVVPEDVYRTRSAAETERYPVGTGPFRVVRHDEGTLVLEAFGGYFRERALMDRIELLYVPKDVSDPRLQPMFHMAKENHYRYPVPEHWQSVQVMTLGSMLLTFNMRKPGPHQDARFREAVHRVLDRTRMIAELHFEDAIPATGFLPSAERTGACPDDCRPEDARRLIEAAGYRGETLRLLALEGHRDLGEWVQGRCADIGVRVEVADLSHRDAQLSNRHMDADGMVSGVVADDDEARCLLEMYTMGTLAIRSYAPDDLRRTFDETIAGIVANPDEEARLAAIRGMEKLLADDFRVLFLAHKTLKTVFSPNVQGVALNTLGWFDFKDMWFKTS